MTGKLWHNYLNVKMALVESDAEAARSAAGEMATAFGKEHHGMQKIAEQMAGSDDLEKQRELFSAFTEEAGHLFGEGLSGGTIYKKYCPMAFNNKGAYWYSDVAEIRNPYFGKEMLRCGSVKETISR
jgi:hypothetical protein